MIAFIPPSRISRKGIIRNVPLDLTDQNILMNIKSPINVISINRLNRKVSNNPSNVREENNTSASVPVYTPSFSVMVTFEGQKLPKYITMFYVSHPVTPYVSRASLCHSCFRFSHTKDNCKSQPRCIHCGEKGHSFSKNHCPRFEEAPRCVNCRGNHRADASNCPEFAIQKEIREYAAHRNLTLRDASEVIRGKRFPPSFSSSSSEEFPPLPTRDRNKGNNINNNVYSTYSPPTTETSYASRFSPQSYAKMANIYANARSQFRAISQPSLSRENHSSISSSFKRSSLDNLRSIKNVQKNNSDLSNLSHIITTFLDPLFSSLTDEIHRIIQAIQTINYSKDLSSHSSKNEHDGYST